MENERIVVELNELIEELDDVGKKAAIKKAMKTPTKICAQLDPDDGVEITAEGNTGVSLILMSILAATVCNGACRGDKEVASKLILNVALNATEYLYRDEDGE